ncbi:DUF2516 family protein [Arthrobacter sp. Br18]|uniref:DUF2516 family protein n=1 Tax=Arthrobacter sp. Br18 TaxID=1312954 RepID=UPI0004AFA7EE|nr:DUF2516 family protein [Arthrobacter sp. Br18]
MLIVLSIQSYLYLILGFVALAIEVWAFTDCVRHKPASFEGALKRTKGFWLALTGGSLVVGLLSALSGLGGGGGFNLFQLVAVVAASVYLADVKPAVSETVGRGGNQGPYGPW